MARKSPVVVFRRSSENIKSSLALAMEKKVGTVRGKNRSKRIEWWKERIMIIEWFSVLPCISRFRVDPVVGESERKCLIYVSLHKSWIIILLYSWGSLNLTSVEDVLVWDFGSTLKSYYSLGDEDFTGKEPVLMVLLQLSCFDKLSWEVKALPLCDKLSSSDANHSIMVKISEVFSSPNGQELKSSGKPLPISLLSKPIHFNLLFGW